MPACRTASRCRSAGWGWKKTSPRSRRFVRRPPLLREPLKNAAVPAMGGGCDSFDVGAPPTTAYRRHDDYLAVGRDVDGRIGIDPDAIQESLVENEGKAVRDPREFRPHPQHGRVASLRPP